jgi:hypothetical protein
MESRGRAQAPHFRPGEVRVRIRVTGASPVNPAFATPASQATASACACACHAFTINTVCSSRSPRPDAEPRQPDGAPVLSAGPRCCAWDA